MIYNAFKSLTEYVLSKESTAASGRQATVIFLEMALFECPLSMKADVHGCSNRSPPKFSLRMAALPSKTAVGLHLV
jgi:hypothetical protein